MEAPLEMNIIIHVKGDDQPDQGVSGRNRNKVHGEKWDIGKYINGPRKRCFGDGDSEI